MQVLKLIINMREWDATMDHRDFVLWLLQVADCSNVEHDNISMALLSISTLCRLLAILLITCTTTLPMFLVLNDHYLQTLFILCLIMPVLTYSTKNI